MSEPEFLTLDEVLGIHADQIRVYGGASGLCDLALLRSAIAMPETTFDGEYLHPSVFEMAAAYLFHLARNHPFADGNKRTALMCALVFLGLNGQRLRADPAALYSLVDGVGRGRRREGGGFGLPQATLLGSMSREWDLDRPGEVHPAGPRPHDAGYAQPAWVSTPTTARHAIADFGVSC